jgi:hypothetical protein
MAAEETFGPGIVALANELVERARDDGATLRALGGVGVALRCRSARAPGPLARQYSDLDFATRRGEQKRIAATMTAAGLAPAARFNAMQGASRLRFEREDGLHADVFVDSFELCHALPLRGRLPVDDTTLPLADLLLTKLQVGRLNHKDVTDAVALLLDHDLAGDDRGISLPYVTGVLAGDWGWWRTVTENLGHVTRLLSDLPLLPAQRTVVMDRAARLVHEVEEAPKSARWRLRARIGERRPWRNEPEDLGAVFAT